MQEPASSFREELSHILDRRGPIAPRSLSYLVDLMTNSITSEAVWAAGEKTYLVDLYLEAKGAPGRIERMQRLRQLGDYSLFISGYFPDSINNHSYYTDMGSAAYYQVAKLGKRPMPYVELATRYQDCVSALTHLSLVNKLYKFEEVGSMYQIYTDTKSPTLKRKLYRLGVVNLEGAIG